MRIRRLVPVLFLPLALATTAHAAPQPKSAAYTTFVVTSGAASYEVLVLAVDGGQARVTVRVDDDLKYAGPAAVTVSATGATLRTRLGSTPLTVTWSGVEQKSVALTGDDSSVVTGLGYVLVGHGAVAKVQLGEAACTIDVFSIVGTVVGDELPSSAAPLSKASLEGSSCGEVAHSTVP